MTNSDKALEEIRDGMKLGLGSGRAATAFVRELGKRVADGLHVTAVPTSQGTADLAKELGIPLVGLGDIDELDLAIDGADEVSPTLELIKGLGGALVREKLVAAAARRFIVLVGSEKIVAKLGDHGVLPVEVVAFGLPLVQRRLRQRGIESKIRQKNNQTFISDNGNPILDLQIGPLADAAELDRFLHDLPGVVDTGLFLNMASVVLVQDGSDVRILARS